MWKEKGVSPRQKEHGTYRIRLVASRWLFKGREEHVDAHIGGAKWCVRVYVCVHAEVDPLIMSPPVLASRKDSFIAHGC